MVYLPKGSIMKWNDNPVTEHNRSELSVDVERLGASTRTAHGLLRKWVTADKRTFSCSWEMLPAVTEKTVDGKWGGDAIEDFYNSTPGAFTLTLGLTSGEETYTVVFSDFSKSVQRRTGASDLVKIDVTLEEV